MIYILTCPKHDIKLFKFIYTNLIKKQNEQATINTNVRVIISK